MGSNGLALIREKNRKKQSFSNTEIDYSGMAKEDVEYIRNEIFNKIVKPLNYKALLRYIEDSN